MLQTSGAIAMSDVAVELGLASTANLTLDDSRVRKLAKLETAGSAIGLGNLYGKARLEYQLTKQVVPNWGSYSVGSFYLYLVGLKITITEPSNVVLSRVIGYDESDAVIFDSPFVYSGSEGGWNVLTKNTGNGGSSLKYIDGSSVGTPSNFAILCRYYRNTGSYGSTLTINRLEVVDTNGNVYRLDNHRNVQVTGPYKQEMDYNTSMYDRFWALASIKAIQDAVIPPNN